MLAQRKERTFTSYESTRSLFHQIQFLKEQEQQPDIVPIHISNKVIHVPSKLDTPEHIGQVMKSPYRTGWTDAIYDNYEKMHTT